jgi:hypothetical protein
MMPSKSVHRITPQEVTSASATGLIAHVMSGRPVTLVAVPEDGASSFPEGS